MTRNDLLDGLVGSSAVNLRLDRVEAHRVHVAGLVVLLEHVHGHDDRVVLERAEYLRVEDDDAAVGRGAAHQRVAPVQGDRAHRVAIDAATTHTIIDRRTERQSPT